MNDRALTKSQKKQIITKLYKLWLRNPDLRLGQLIENAFLHVEGTEHCFYHIEDFPFLEALEKFYDKTEKPTN